MYLKDIQIKALFVIPTTHLLFGWSNYLNGGCVIDRWAAILIKKTTMTGTENLPLRILPLNVSLVNQNNFVSGDFLTKAGRQNATKVTQWACTLCRNQRSTFRVITKTSSSSVHYLAVVVFIFFWSYAWQSSVDGLYVIQCPISMLVHLVRVPFWIKLHRVSSVTKFQKGRQIDQRGT